MILLGSIIFVIIFMAFVMSNNDGAEMNTVTSPAEIKNNGVSREYIVSQLIGKERFLSEYGVLVSSLRKNAEFMRFVNRLRIELAGEEFKNPKTANKRIADYFYYNNANERFPEVDFITRKVRTYGKQASAHISIYYAMYLEE